MDCIACYIRVMGREFYLRGLRDLRNLAGCRLSVMKPRALGPSWRAALNLSAAMEVKSLDKCHADYLPERSRPFDHRNHRNHRGKRWDPHHKKP